MCLLTANDQADLLSQMTKRLVDNGYVTDGFLQDLLEREKVYPTGLQIDGVPYAFAIPHANSSCVLMDSICIATLKNPVSFKRMDDPDLSIDVSIVFMLANKNSKKHIELLSTIVHLFQNKAFSKRLMSSKGFEELATSIESEVEEFNRRSK